MRVKFNAAKIMRKKNSFIEPVLILPLILTCKGQKGGIPLGVKESSMMWLWIPMNKPKRTDSGKSKKLSKVKRITKVKE